MRLLILLVCVLTWNSSVSAMDFIHPGGINSKSELDFVKARIKAGVQPWKGEFDQLKHFSYASRGANGLQNINSAGEDADVSRDDAIAAYAQSRLWYFSGEEQYAVRSIAILNAWSNLQETCRDNGHHSQFGLGSALHAAEIAWHQGVDVYGENQERYTEAMELLASQFISGSMKGVSENDVPTSNRYDAWEIGYNHYYNRKGIALPNTEKLIREQIRPKAPRAVCNLAFDMLTHIGLPKVPN